MDAALVAGVKIDNVARFCRELGANPRTFYRHRARVEAEGQWQERSRRPRTSPGRVPADLDAWICKLRADLGADNGADFIRVALWRVHAEVGPSWRVPARSTINWVLDRQLGCWRCGRFARRSTSSAREITMGLRYLGKDPAYDGGQSPTVWDDGDAYVVQGWRINDPATLAEVGDIPPHETLIRIPNTATVLRHV